MPFDFDGPMSFDDLAAGPRGDGTPASPDWLPADSTQLSFGHGADACELTEEDIARLRRGEIMILNARGEYAVYLRLRRPSSGAIESPG